MIIWMTTFVLITIGLSLMYDSINIVVKNKSKIRLPLIIPASDHDIKLQRIFHNELAIGALAIVLGLVILEISFIDIVPKAITLLVLYLVVDALGYLRTEKSQLANHK